MQRSSTVAITDFMKGTSVRPRAQIKRGYIMCDFAELSGKTDGATVGTVHGLRVKRKASLSNGQIQFYADNGSLIAQNF
jgi:hypothetical protein